MPNAKELIDTLVSRGMSQSEIAEAVERDQSYISQIRRGKKRGNNLTVTLTELTQTGTVKTKPERRRTAKGIAHVRGRKGEGKVVPPGSENTRRTGRKITRHETVPARGKFAKNTTYGRGFRKVRIDFPRTQGSKGKEQAWQEAEKNIRSMARKKWGGKELPDRRIHLSATYEDGSKVEFGSKSGYQPRAILGSLDEHDGDVEDWLKTQGLEGRYDDFNQKSRMVAIEINGVVRS